MLISVYLSYFPLAIIIKVVFLKKCAMHSKQIHKCILYIDKLGCAYIDIYVKYIYDVCVRNNTPVFSVFETAGFWALYQFEGFLCLPVFSGCSWIIKQGSMTTVGGWDGLWTGANHRPAFPWYPGRQTAWGGTGLGRWLSSFASFAFQPLGAL